MEQTAEIDPHVCAEVVVELQVARQLDELVFWSERRQPVSADLEVLAARPPSIKKIPVRSFVPPKEEPRVKTQVDVQIAAGVAIVGTAARLEREERRTIARHV